MSDLNKSQGSSETQKWIDLSKYGIDFKIIPAIDGVRDKGCVLHINDLNKYMEVTGHSEQKLKNLIDSCNFKYYPSDSTNKTPNQLTLVYDLEYDPTRDKPSLHLPHIAEFVGLQSRNELTYIESPVSELTYKPSPTSINEWKPLLQELNQDLVGKHYYRPKDNLPPQSINKAVDRLKNDSHPLFVRSYMDDPLPFNELAALGYTSNSISTVYTSLKHAQDAGYTIDQLDVIQPTKDNTCPLPFSVNKDGSLNIINDIRKVPELFNYSPNQHNLWVNRFDLQTEVEHLVALSADVRELSTNQSDLSNDDDLEIHLNKVSVTLDRINKYGKNRSKLRHKIRFNRTAEIMLSKNAKDNRWYFIERSLKEGSSVDKQYTRKELLTVANYPQLMRSLNESARTLTQAVDNNPTLSERIRPLQEATLKVNTQKFTSLVERFEDELGLFKPQSPHYRTLDKQANSIDAPTQVNASQDNILSMIQGVDASVAKTSTQDVDPIAALAQPYKRPSSVSNLVVEPNSFDTPEEREKMRKFNELKVKEVLNNARALADKFKAQIAAKEQEKEAPTVSKAKDLQSQVKDAEKHNASPEKLTKDSEQAVLKNNIPLNDNIPSQDSSYEALKAEVKKFSELPKGFTEKSDKEYDLASKLYSYRQVLTFIELPIAQERIKGIEDELAKFDKIQSDTISNSIKGLALTGSVDQVQMLMESNSERADLLKKLDAARYETAVVEASINNIDYQFSKRYLDLNQFEQSGKVRVEALENLVLNRDQSGKYIPFATPADYSNAQEQAQQAYSRLALHSDYKPDLYPFANKLRDNVRSELVTFRADEPDTLSAMSRSLHKFDSPVTALSSNVVIPPEVHPHSLNVLHQTILKNTGLFLNKPDNSNLTVKPSDFNQAHKDIDMALTVIGRFVQRSKESTALNVDYFKDANITAMLNDYAKGADVSSVSLKEKLTTLEKVVATSESTINALGFEKTSAEIKNEWEIQSAITKLVATLDHERINKVSNSFEKSQALNFILQNVEAYPPKHDQSIKSKGWAIEADNYTLKPVDLNKAPSENEIVLKSKDYQNALSESFAVYRKNWLLNELNIKGTEAKAINDLAVELKQQTVDEAKVRSLTTKLLGGELTSSQLKSISDFKIENQKLNEHKTVSLASFDVEGVPNTFKDLPILQAKNILDRVNLVNHLAAGDKVNDPLIDYAIKPSNTFEQLKGYFTPNSQEQKNQLADPKHESIKQYVSTVSEQAHSEYLQNASKLINADLPKSGIDIAVTALSYQPKSANEVAFTRIVPADLVSGFNSNANFVSHKAYNGDDLKSRISQSVYNAYSPETNPLVFPKINDAQIGDLKTPEVVTNITEQQKDALKLNHNNDIAFIAPETRALFAMTEVALQNMSPALTQDAVAIANNEKTSPTPVQLYLVDTNKADLPLPELKIASTYESLPVDAKLLFNANLNELIHDNVVLRKGEFDPKQIDVKGFNLTRDLEYFIGKSGIDIKELVEKANPEVQQKNAARQEHLSRFDSVDGNHNAISDVYVSILKEQLNEYKQDAKNSPLVEVVAEWEHLQSLPELKLVDASLNSSHNAGKYLGTLNTSDQDAVLDVNATALIMQNQDLLHPVEQKVILDSLPQYKFALENGEVSKSDISIARSKFMNGIHELNSDFEMVDYNGLKGASVFLKKEDDSVVLALAATPEKAYQLVKNDFYPFGYDQMESLNKPLDAPHDVLVHNAQVQAEAMTDFIKNYEISPELKEKIASSEPSIKIEDLNQNYLQTITATSTLAVEIVQPNIEIEEKPAPEIIQQRGDYYENQGKTFKYSEVIEMSDASASENLVKNNLWKPVSVEQAAEKKYMNIDAYVLAEAVRDSLPNKPIYTDKTDEAQVQRDRVYFNSLISNTFKAVADSHDLSDLVQNLRTAQQNINKEALDSAEQRKKYSLEVINAISSSLKNAESAGLNISKDLSEGLKFTNNPALNEAWNKSVQKLLAHEAVDVNSKSFVSVMNKFDLNAPSQESRQLLSDVLYARLTSQPIPSPIDLNKFMPQSPNPILNEATRSHVDTVNMMSTSGYPLPFVDSSMLNMKFGPGATNLAVSLSAKTSEHFNTLDKVFDFKEAETQLGTTIYFSSRGEAKYDPSSDTIHLNTNQPKVDLNSLWAKALDHKLLVTELNHPNSKSSEVLNTLNAPYLSTAIAMGYKPVTDSGKAFEAFAHAALGKGNNPELNFKEAHDLVNQGVSTKLVKLQEAIAEIRKEQPEVATFIDWSISKGEELNSRLNTKLDAHLAKDYKVAKNDSSLNAFKNSLSDVDNRIDNIKLNASSLNVGMVVKAHFANADADKKTEVTDKIIEFSSSDKFNEVNRLFTDYLSAKQASDALALVNKHAPDALKDTNELCKQLATTYVGSYVGVTGNGVTSEAAQENSLKYSLETVSVDHETINQAISHVVNYQINTTNENGISRDFNAEYTKSVEAIAPNRQELIDTLSKTMDAIKAEVENSSPVFVKKPVEPEPEQINKKKDNTPALDM